MDLGFRGERRDNISGRLAKEAYMEKNWPTHCTGNKPCLPGNRYLWSTLWETEYCPPNLFLWDHSWSGRRIWVENLISTGWLFTSLMEFSFLDVLTAVVYWRAACFCRALQFLFITGETLRKHTCNRMFSSPLHCVKSFRGHMFCSSCDDIWGWIAE